MEMLNKTIREVLQVLQEEGYKLEFSGDDTAVIDGFSDPGNYIRNTVIWAGKAEDIRLPVPMNASDISLLLVKPSFEGKEDFPNVVIMDDPRNAFMWLASFFYRKERTPGIAGTASVGRDVSLGEGTQIKDRVILKDHVVIGKGCVIDEGVYIGESTVIGDGCLIGQNTVIGGESVGSLFFNIRGEQCNMPNVGGVEVGNNVQIGPRCEIDSGTFFRTVIGDNCVLDSGTIISHNCRIGAGTRFLGPNFVNGNVVIGHDCELITATIKNRVTIGDHVRVGIGSVVIHDIGSGKTCFGNPARALPGK